MNMDDEHDALSRNSNKTTVPAPQHHKHATRSSRSFTFASAIVCHCILSGSSTPPAHSGFMWSITHSRTRSALLVGAWVMVEVLQRQMTVVFPIQTRA